MRDTEVVKIAKALADPTRLKMLHEIRRAGRLTCSQVCDKFPQSQPTISHHIKTLEGAGLISVQRQGQFHVLSVNDPAIQAFVAVLGGAAGRSSAGEAKLDPDHVQAPAKPASKPRSRSSP